MAMEVTKDELETALDQVDVELHEDYSGRGMYGETCFGVDGSRDDCEEFESELAKAVTLGWFSRSEGTPEEVLDVFMEKLADIRNARRTDSMGMDIIFYYPRIKVTEA